MTTDPGKLDLRPEALERATTLLREEVKAGRLMGAALQVARRGRTLAPICVGRRRLADDGPAVGADTRFLIASITKPIVAASVMRLVEDGRVILDDPVAAYVPEFGVNGKKDVRVRHVLSHTSGLPDMIPENMEYRRAKRPLKDFVKRTCELPLMFPPGARISYQSCGIMMLGEIAERVTGIGVHDWVKKTIFEPLGLKDTTLGGRARSERESDVKLAGEGAAPGGAARDATDYDWNSEYWRGFGAPWGGMFTTADEMTLLMRAFLAGGTLNNSRVLGRATVEAMVTDQTSGLPDLSDRDRRSNRWGLGWHLQTRIASTFGDFASDRTFGHGGATGTWAFADRDRDLTFVLFTNDPAGAQGLRPRIANLVVGAVER